MTVLDSEMDPSGVSVLIETLEMVQSSRSNLRTGWRCWIEWCRELGVGPLEARGPDLVGFLQGNHSKNSEENTLWAVRFGYEKSGLLSPTWDMEVRRLRGGKNLGDRLLADYNPRIQRTLKLRTDDYLRWCRENGRTAVPASAEDVAEFLPWLADQYGITRVMLGSIAVWHLHREQGLENITKHPLVSEALTECHRRCDARKGQPRPLSPSVKAQRGRYERNWRSWCEGEGIDDVFDATPRDAVRYLESFEGHLSVDVRIRGLSDLYEGRDNPFASDEVACWRRDYLARVPEMRARHQAEEARWAEVPDPALEFTGRKLGDDWLKPGLTVEDRALVEQALDSRFSEATRKAYFDRGWKGFARWLEKRGLTAGEIESEHLVIYLARRGQEVVPSTLSRELAGITFVLDSLVDGGENPADSAEVFGVLAGLRGAERQKRLRPSQLFPIRERHYQQLVERRMEVPPWNKEWEARIYNLVDIAVVGFGRDGMLRGTELCTALKSDLEPMRGGAGRLYIPYSKTDQDGEGVPVYISERSMGDVARMWEAMVNAGLWDEHEERIFPLKRSWISQRIKDAAVRLGLSGKYGSHSLRIGMSQDLAVAGFSLPMIMRAGRWKTPEMPAHYIQGLVPEEFAIARLHEMWHRGEQRTERDLIPYDVLWTYQGLRVG